jgi:hypothetical protein
MGLRRAAATPAFTISPAIILSDFTPVTTAAVGVASALVVAATVTTTGAIALR